MWEKYRSALRCSVWTLPGVYDCFIKETPPILSHTHTLGSCSFTFQLILTTLESFFYPIITVKTDFEGNQDIYSTTVLMNFCFKLQYMRLHKAIDS